MLVISSDGRILYTSDTISTYLGLRQVRTYMYVGIVVFFFFSFLLGRGGGI